MPGAVQGPRGSAVWKSDKALALSRAYMIMENTEDKHVKYLETVILSM